MIDFDSLLSSALSVIEAQPPSLDKKQLLLDQLSCGASLVNIRGKSRNRFKLIIMNDEQDVYLPAESKISSMKVLTVGIILLNGNQSFGAVESIAEVLGFNHLVHESGSCKLIEMALGDTLNIRGMFGRHIEPAIQMIKHVSKESLHWPPYPSPYPAFRNVYIASMCPKDRDDFLETLTEYLSLNQESTIEHHIFD